MTEQDYRAAYPPPADARRRIAYEAQVRAMVEGERPWGPPVRVLTERTGKRRPRHGHAAPSAGRRIYRSILEWSRVGTIRRSAWDEEEDEDGE